MIDLERRLQHAARELRELEIEPPPLSALACPGRRPSRRSGRAAMAVMPALFVLGGLAMLAAGTGRHVDDLPDGTPAVVASAQETADPVSASAPATPALSARQEIALIASLAPADPAPSAPRVGAPTVSRPFR